LERPGTIFGPSRTALTTKEGVGETSGQTAGSNFKKRSRFGRAVRQKKQVFFVRCGSLEIRNVTGDLLTWWDLVLTCSPTPSFQPEQVTPGLSFPDIAAVL
jgi:hypothetical protein